jgi:hypothetical protein
LSAEPTLVVFLGGMGGSPIEDAVHAARRAATLDTIETARRADIDEAIVLTDDPDLSADLPGVEVIVDVREHHFGKQLAETVRARSLRSVVYLGGGSVPLLSEAGFAEIVSRLLVSTAVTNNRFSSDLIAWNPDAAGLNVVEKVSRDNTLARALQESGVEMSELPRSVETLADIDGPTDLAVFALTGLGGERLQSALTGVDVDLEPYRRVLPVFTDRNAELVISGRVSSHVWQYAERETACRVRVFAEERGMEADGRVEAGDVRSLIALLIETVGLNAFFEALADMGDAAIIDTRVLLAHKRIDASRDDRFLSDARRWNEIGEPFLRELTKIASSSELPVLLGGHSLVSGSLIALNEFAWEQSEAGLLTSE